MSEIRKECRWALRTGGRWWCRRKSFDDPKAGLDPLDLGCQCDPEKDYQRQAWKADLYGDPDERGDAQRGEPPKVVDWEEET